MSVDEVIECGKGGRGTVREVVFSDLGREIIKRQLPFLNDTLQKLVTLNATLLGGSIVFLQADRATAWGRWGAAVSFFISLGAALWGMLPFPGGFRIECPEEIEADHRRGVDWKSQMVKWAAAWLFIGLAVAFAGAIFHTGDPSQNQ